MKTKHKLTTKYITSKRKNQKKANQMFVTPESDTYTHGIHNFIKQSGESQQTTSQQAQLKMTQHQRSNLIDEGVTEWALGAKGLHLCCHVLFSLRIERRVLNQAIDKHPNVAFNLPKKENEKNKQTWVMNLSVKVHFDPNCLACRVMFSFV
jgi:hypothetical protein